MPVLFFEKPDRLTLAYLITLPLILLLGIAAAPLTQLLAPYTPEAIEAAALFALGALTASNLLSALFAARYFYKVRRSTDYWLLIAVFVLFAFFAFNTLILIPIAIYALTLLSTRKTSGITAPTLLIRMGVPTAAIALLSVLSLIIFSNLLIGDHYYREPIIGKGGFYHSELYDSSLSELIEADDSHVIGIYSHTDSEEITEIGFALFAAKEADGQALYQFIADSGHCYPETIFECDSEGYTQTGHVGDGFAQYETVSWRTWKSVDETHSVCLIPADNPLVPDEGIDLLRVEEITLGGVDFRLYIGLGTTNSTE